MSHAPLHRVVVEIVGAPFHALVGPEDGAVRAAGFETGLAGESSASEAGSPGSPVPETPARGNSRASTLSDAHAAPLAQRLAAVDPQTAARGIVDYDEAAAPAGVRTVAEALRAYANGQVHAIDALPVSQEETPFRGEVWRALRRVAPGEPVTYTELAELAGRPSAVRAAASGCASNLVALIVPCHRIVRTDGGLGGYLFGTDLKQRLLDLEASPREA